MNKYNEIKLNKTKQDIKKQCCLLCTLRKGLAESWKALSSSPVCSRGEGGDCLDIQDRDLCDNSPLVEAAHHCHKELHTRFHSSSRSTPLICF